MPELADRRLVDVDDDDRRARLGARLDVLVEVEDERAQAVEDREFATESEKHRDEGQDAGQADLDNAAPVAASR